LCGRRKCWQGPARYTPGTKMPEQRITAPEDREALVEFLEKATGDQKSVLLWRSRK
jgi:cytochrome c2